MKRHFYGYGNISDTNLETIIVSSKELYSKPFFADGDEGRIYRFGVAEAIKVFTYEKPLKLHRSFAKLELLGKLKDDSFEYPKRLVGFENSRKAGFLMDFVETKPEVKDYAKLKVLKDLNLIIKYLISASEAMRRAHKDGVIIGDLHGSNIMLDIMGNPRFIDTNSYAIGNYGFSGQSDYASLFHKKYGKKIPGVDSDKFLFAILALKGLLFNFHFDLYNCYPDLYDEIIKMLNANQHIKELLKATFSDSVEKPYMDEILREIDASEVLIDESLPKAQELKRYNHYSFK
jgi:hypothetical protein